ncbi:MAG: hypothetical protein WCR42_07685 [bacterium]
MKKYLIILIFFCLTATMMGKGAGFMFNKGMATYIDDSDGSHYSITFKTDTVKPEPKLPGSYYIDSVFYQIQKYKIPDNKLMDKYFPEKEKVLLEYYKDFEFNYQKDTLYSGRYNFSPKTEFFTNQYGKQFLLWYYESPEYSDSIYQQNKRYLKDSSTTVKYQIYTLFIANSSCVLLNTFAVDDRKFNERVNLIKNDISNNVRVFHDSIDNKILYRQIASQQIGKPYVLTNKRYGFKIELPFWANVTKGYYQLNAGFPDIYNITNALELVLFPKTNYPALIDFIKYITTSEGIIKCSKLDFQNSKLNCYEIIRRNDAAAFKCQYVMFETPEKYGLINFTATESTYNLNLPRFNEFLDKVEILE